jgi:hypothetical protein
MSAKTTLTPPRRVRIGHRFYSVEYVPSIQYEQTECNGLCVFNESKILIYEGLTPDVMAEVFTHECLHAIHWEAGLTDESDEETYTTLTAKALCRFYQDNPSATKWLLASLKPPKD